MLKSRLKTGGVLLVGLLLCGTVTVFVGKMLYIDWQDRRQADPVPGTVLNRALEQVNDGPVGATRPQPVVTYRYTHAGTTYTNDDLTPSPRRYESPSRVRELLGAYPPGKEVTVYVPPHRPKESFLVRKGPGVWMLAFFGTFLLVTLACTKGLFDAIRDAQPSPER